MDTLDPIDAAIGVSNGGWKAKDSQRAVSEHLDEAQAFKYGRDMRSVEQALNEGKEIARQAHVFAARDLGDGRVLVTRGETPYEARLRLQTAEGHLAPLSFHSAIPNNPEHSRRVLAYDIAIGAGESVDDVTFYQYLCRVADWRLDWKSTRDGAFDDTDDLDLPNEEVRALYRAEETWKSQPDRRHRGLSQQRRVPPAGGEQPTLPSGNANHPGAQQRQTRALWRINLMRRLLVSLSLVGLLAGSPALHAADSPLPELRCFPNPATPISAYTSAKEARMSNVAYQAPTTSPRLETLDVLSLGISLDVFRQGQLWHTLQQQSVSQPEALHVGSILPIDPKKYPVTADDKNLAYNKREADTLELGLKSFLEKWPIPTVTVVQSWNPSTPNLRFTPEETRESLSVMVNDMRVPAGLHWHRIRNLQDGVICDDTPEGVLEALFLLFENHPDLPAVLVYANEGISMSYALSSREVSRKSLGAVGGPRQADKLTDSMVALIVGRPERVDWLRYYAPFTKVNANKIDPEFRGWGWRKPSVEFQPSPFIPQPWTERALEQWDAMPVLAKLHRPVTVSLTNPDSDERLKRDALTTQLAAGWKQATDALSPQPARVFYDGGLNSQPLAELTPALSAAHSTLDLLDSRESYDLTQRLGDTGAASPFVGIALATMASYLNADSSVVIPLRRQDQATIIAVTSPTPGKKPTSNPFGTNLMPQNASSDTPVHVPQPDAPAQAEPSISDASHQDDYVLEQFLADLPRKKDWMDDL